MLFQILILFLKFMFWDPPICTNHQILLFPLKPKFSRSWDPWYLTSGWTSTWCWSTDQRLSFLPRRSSRFFVFRFLRFARTSRLFVSTIVLDIFRIFFFFRVSFFSNFFLFFVLRVFELDFSEKVILSIFKQFSYRWLISFNYSFKLDFFLKMHINNKPLLSGPRFSFGLFKVEV